MFRLLFKVVRMLATIGIGRFLMADVHSGKIHRSHTHSKDSTCVEASGRRITQVAKMSIDPKFVERNS